jgi:hypothetical protein
MQEKIIKTANKCFENVGKFKYFEITVTNQNYIEKEVMSR